MQCPNLNSYKMFAEVFWSLMRPDGRLGVILPTGIYSDFGTTGRCGRHVAVHVAESDFLYAFQNEEKPVFCSRDTTRTNKLP